MAGKTPHQALINYLQPLQRALSVVSRAQFYVLSVGLGRLDALALSEDPLRLRTADGELRVSIQQQFEVIRSEDKDRGPFKVSTRAYRYQVADEADREVVAFHWHPTSRSMQPHLHLTAGAIQKKHHVPTGRVSIESVLRFLIEDVEVRTLRDDWRRVLDEHESAFVRWRTWG